MTSTPALSSVTNSIPSSSFASSRSAVSVFEPMKTFLPSSPPSKAVELIAIDCIRSSFTAGESFANALPNVMTFSSPFLRMASFAKSKVVPKLPATTVILFCVKVPVLSEQIVVALPIVSQARRCLTRLFSFNIFLVANDRANVTATGKPSGTATTIMVMATMSISRN